MSEFLAGIEQCRIALDEADWAIRVGLFQVALTESTEEWYSRDGEWHYKLTSSYDPYEGISYIDGRGQDQLILDPDKFSEDSRPLNPGKWMLGRIPSKDVHSAAKKSPLQPDKKVRTRASSTVFIVDETEKRIGVMAWGESAKSETVHVNAPLQYRAEFSEALDDLAVFLNR